MKRIVYKKILLTLGTILLFFFVFTTNTFAAVKCWVGPAGGNWSTAANWQTTAGVTSALTSADIATFDPGKVTCTGATATNTNSTIDTAAAGTVTGIDIKSGYNQTITQNANVTLTANFTSAGGTWTPTSGTITLSGAVSQTINTGSLLASSTLVINKGSGTFAVVIATSTVVNLGNSPTSVMSTNYQGDLTNNGTILVGTGVWNISNWNGYFTNNGTISGSSSSWNFSGVSFINNVGATTNLSGTWTIYGGYYGGYINNYGTINNSGSVMDFNGTTVFFTNNSSGVFNFSNGATTTTTGNFTNNGTYNIPASHLLIIDGDTNQSMGGIIGGTVIINKGSGGNLTFTTSASINLGSNATTTVNPTYTGLSGIITNNGTITVNSGSLTFKNAGVNSNVDFVNNGSLIHNGNSWNIGDTAYVNYINNPGATTTYAGTTITANGSFTQNGTFNMTGKTITFNNYMISRTLTANGALGGSVIISSSNLIIASGTSITLATTSMGGSCIKFKTLESLLN